MLANKYLKVWENGKFKEALLNYNVLYKFTFFETPTI